MANRLLDACVARVMDVLVDLTVLLRYGFELLLVLLCQVLGVFQLVSQFEKLFTRLCAFSLPVCFQAIFQLSKGAGQLGGHFAQTLDISHLGNHAHDGVHIPIVHSLAEIATLLVDSLPSLAIQALATYAPRLQLRGLRHNHRYVVQMGGTHLIDHELRSGVIRETALLDLANVVNYAFTVELSPREK